LSAACGNASPSPSPGFLERHASIQLVSANDTPRNASVQDGIDANDPDCATVYACQRPDGKFGEGPLQPAIHFELSSDRVVHIEADLYDGLDCANYVDTLVADLMSFVGPSNPFIDLGLPTGYELSIGWRVDDCVLSCSNYTMGVDPAMCPAP